jgi:hypothetical protein
MSDRLETPWERWSRDPREIVPLRPQALERAFVCFLRRSPSNDGLVPIKGVDYELPPELKPRGHKKEPVQILHRLLSDTYHVAVAERLVQLHPVDLEANARASRARGAASDEDSPDSVPPPRSAADMAFERGLGPVTDPDGGFADTPPAEDP